MYLTFVAQWILSKIKTAISLHESRFENELEYWYGHMTTTFEDHCLPRLEQHEWNRLWWNKKYFLRFLLLQPHHSPTHNRQPHKVIIITITSKGLSEHPKVSILKPRQPRLTNITTFSTYQADRSKPPVPLESSPSHPRSPARFHTDSLAEDQISETATVSNKSLSPPKPYFPNTKTLSSQTRGWVGRFILLLSAESSLAEIGFKVLGWALEGIGKVLQSWLVWCGTEGSDGAWDVGFFLKRVFLLTTSSVRFWLLGSSVEC